MCVLPCIYIVYLFYPRPIPTRPFFGIIGNIIAIAALSGSKQGRKSSAFFALVCGLAITDLLGTCLASPITIATYLDKNVLHDRHLCEFHSFLLLFFGVAGLSIICAMSAERYLAICCPYTYQRWGIGPHFARKCLFCIYLSNIIFCCLPVMGMTESMSQPSKTWCFINWMAHEPLSAAYSFLYASVSFLLILMTIVLNFAVCGTLLIMHRRKIQRPVTRGSPRAHWTALSSGVEAQMMTVLVVTSMVVLGCSAPLVVRVFANQISREDNSHADLKAIRIAAVNAILDPWIYILLRRTLTFHYQTNTHDLPTLYSSININQLTASLPLRLQHPLKNQNKKIQYIRESIQT
uniref:G-protein coupled receptors family 1 profile domain-containing protein n=1 Tax=Oncorhynchus tshawytscha TaxID=74940 RepID=A0A8C8I913_ONCTS